MTDFRGFREFGVIGATGMILCWIATYLALPALLVAMDWLVPKTGADTAAPGWTARLRRATEDGTPFGKPFAALVHTKLNSLNFIALPITLRIGVDYAVNVDARDLEVADATLVVRRTGGAVILCILTTLLGYFALVRSTTFAVRSLGIAAVVGEVSCLLAAVLVLPAALTWWRARRALPVRGAT